MCFSNYREQTNAKIAQEDIPCFKALDQDEDTGRLHSPVKTSTKWRIGKLKTAWFMKKKGTPDSLYRGIHSAKTQSTAWEYGQPYNAVIPKGSYYWENDREYISNKLIIVGKV